MKGFLVCLAIVTVRGWERLWQAGIWAEDGSIYLQDALVHGWRSLFSPYAGYYHTLGRIVTQLALLFPTVALPTIITFSCYVLYAGVMSMIVDKTYRYLIKSDQVRFCVAAGLCLVPGFTEVLGNLCNSHRILAPYVLFLALRSIQDSYKVGHLAMTFLAAGSAGEVFVFIPLFLYRLYKRVKLKKQIVLDVILILVLVGWTLLTIMAREIQPSGIALNLSELFQAIVASTTTYFLLQPNVGYRMSMNLSNHVPILFWPVCFGFGTLLVRDIWRNRLSPQILIYLGVMGLFASQALGWIVRPGSIYWYKKYAPGMPWWGMRESFTLAFAGYLLWSLYFGRVSKKAGVIFVVVYFLLMPSFWVKPYGEVSYWKRVAADLDQSIKTGCPKQVRVKYFPTNWQFDYVSQQPEAAHCH